VSTTNIDGGIHKIAKAHMLLARKVDDFGRQITERFDVSMIEWLLLGEIASASAAGGVRVTDLANTFEVKSTYVTAVLNDLRRKQYVESRQDNRDARVRLTVLSAKGRKSLSQVEAYANQALTGGVWGGMSLKQLRQVVGVV
jgi:DNA-binding MarR family transcriptional regulator